MTTVGPGISAGNFERKPLPTTKDLEILDNTRIIPSHDAQRLIGSLATFGYKTMADELAVTLGSEGSDGTDVILNPMSAKRVGYVMNQLGLVPTKFGIRPVLSEESHE